MAYNIRKNWVESLNLMTGKPVIILPFIIIAFLEALALELIYFFPVKPISFIVNPLVRKFFGEAFVHYPGNLLILPKLFHYAGMVIYVFCGVFFTAIAINIFKNIKEGLPLRIKALLKNAFGRYLSLVGYGLIIAIFAVSIRKAYIFVFPKFSPLGLTLLLFLSNVIIHTFLILAVPLMVMKKKSLLRALATSISLGWRNFAGIFALIFLPFLVYLPILLLKSHSVKLIGKTFPGMNVYLAGCGIVLAIFLNCFVIVCASQFVLDVDTGK